MAIYNGGLNIIAQDISGKEDKSNKVTSWSATTDDTHYPSEKLVKGALDGKAEKSEIEASVTTNSLTAGAINPQGTADIGSPSKKFNEVYALNMHTDAISTSTINGLVFAPLMGLCDRSFNDWNDATATGFYAMKSAANAPGDEVWYFGLVISFGDDGWLLQTAYPFTNPSSLKTRPTFQRSQYGGNWSSWEEINSAKYGAVFN